TLDLEQTPIGRRASRVVAFVGFVCFRAWPRSLSRILSAALSSTECVFRPTAECGDAVVPFYLPDASARTDYGIAVVPLLPV
ncbi:unnamed protein product, partial [Ixodes persulcatus]